MTGEECFGGVLMYRVLKISYQFSFVRVANPCYLLVSEVTCRATDWGGGHT